jgi:hypothetical protein
LGGAVFLAIGENIFVSSLVKNLHRYVPTIYGQKVVTAELELESGLLAYDVAITQVFYL